MFRQHINSKKMIQLNNKTLFLNAKKLLKLKAETQNIRINGIALIEVSILSPILETIHVSITSLPNNNIFPYQRIVKKTFYKYTDILNFLNK